MTTETPIDLEALSAAHGEAIIEALPAEQRARWESLLGAYRAYERAWPAEPTERRSERLGLLQAFFPTRSAEELVAIGLAIGWWRWREM